MHFTVSRHSATWKTLGKIVLKPLLRPIMLLSWALIVRPLAFLAAPPWRVYWFVVMPFTKSFRFGLSATFGSPDTGKV